MHLTDLKWDGSGLVTVIVQDRVTGQIRMLAHANLEAVRRTMNTGQAHFFSRSREALWRKGESSGNTLQVSEVWADCDGDALVYLAEPAGPTCHTGAATCFFYRGDGSGAFEEARGEQADPVLVRLWDALVARTGASAESSYTKSLLERGSGKIGDKLREEADELARAVSEESPDRVVSEAADVIYHLCVGLLHRGVTLRDVQAELGRRFGRSGHEEKASR